MPQHKLENGQLFITRDLKLSVTPTSYQAARNMSTVSLCKRIKKVGKQSKEEEGTSVKLARLEPISKNTQEAEEEDIPYAQPHPTTEILSSSSEDEGEVDENANSDFEVIKEKKERLHIEEVDDPESAKWIFDHAMSMDKKKQNNWSALLVITMMQELIPILNYPKAYNKYKEIKKEDMTVAVKTVLFKILSYWGRLYINRPSGIDFLQDIMRYEDQRKALSMIVFPCQMRKKLKSWLNPFCEESPLPVPTTNTDLDQLALPHTTLPIPVQHSTTSTSYTPAFGTSHFAGAQVSDNYQGHMDGKDVPANLKGYKLKTSRALSSMFFSQEYRCTLRSPNNCGDIAVKLETYLWKDIRSKPSQEWWKSVDVKGFVMCPYNSRLANLAAEMEQEMRRILESDPSHEGELAFKR